MARFIPGVTGFAPSPRNADPLTDLTRLLSRLQQTILRADAEREARLRTSEYERQKAQTNINYARSLLTKLEQDALSVKINMRRQDLQTDLNRKRELLEQVTERMNDIAEMAAADFDAGGGGDADSDTSDVDDILSEIITMTPSESLDSANSVAKEDLDQDAAVPEDIIPLDMPAPVPSHQLEQTRNEQASGGDSNNEITQEKTHGFNTSQTLRPRPGRGASVTEMEQPWAEKKEPAQAQTTGSSHLYSSSLSSPKQSKITAVATTEAILDHQRAEQDILSESMLKLASDLKASSQALSNSLDEDKELVSRAGEGMSKTGEGMDAVTKRMGTLARMTEGEGYWGRLKLYAMVYGLMVVLVLVVFVLPKLRF